MTHSRRRFLKLGVGAGGAVLFAPGILRAQSAEMPGISDSEIRIGQTVPYSGPLSMYGTNYGKLQQAYCQMINDGGGINGRKLNLISLDDGYQPPRTVEQIRRLVERENVAFIFYIVGTATSRSVIRYLENKKIPHLFAGALGEGFNEPETNPHTMAWGPTSRMEAVIVGQYLAEMHPDKKIGLLYQQDDFGDGVRQGLREGLGEKAANLTTELPYNVSDTTVDSQVLALRASGVEVFYNSATLKHCAQAQKKVNELGWKPVQVVLTTSSSVTRLLQESGSDLPEGTLSTQWYKNPAEKRWDNDPEMTQWREDFMKKYFPEGDPKEPNCVIATSGIQALVHVLQNCGDNLTRENVMNVASSMQDVQLPLLLPGVTLNTSKDNHAPIRQMQLMEYKDKNWAEFGPIWKA